MTVTLQKTALPEREEKITLPARRSSFGILKERILAVAEDLQIQDRIRKQLLIACDEIFTNIASYAYPEEEKNGVVDVSFLYERSTRKLRISFSDSGRAFDPLAEPEKDVKESVAEKKVGGLGLFMVRKMMDSVEYKRENGCNNLTLGKILEGESL